MKYQKIMMESQKIINLLDNTPNQPPKLRTKTQVEIKDDSHGTYNMNSKIENFNVKVKFI